MLREYKTYLRDIFEAASKIEKYTEGIDIKEFEKDELIQDAVVRNLEIIGEAAKKFQKKLEIRSQR